MHSHVSVSVNCRENTGLEGVRAIGIPVVLQCLVAVYVSIQRVDMAGNALTNALRLPDIYPLIADVQQEVDTGIASENV